MMCKKCLLIENKPEIFLDKDGICNICKNHRNNEPEKLLDTDFYNFIKKYKGKHKYDCLLMCSGGKDSVGALYYIKTKYKLNPLVFTFDHGWENEEALKNIRNAVKILDLDFLYYKTDFMKDAFRILIKSGSKAPICHLCALWYIKLTYDTAKKFDIPIIIAGWRKEQSKDEKMVPIEYQKMSRETVSFIKNDLRKIDKYKNFPSNMNEAIGKNKKILAFSPHWFLESDDEKMIKILKEKLDWSAIKSSYPNGSTNCMLNFASVYLSIKNYGFSHYHIEMSNRIRNGETSKEEAQKKLKIDFDEDFINKNILDKLDCKI